MIGNFDDGTNDARYRDIAEYSAYRILGEAAKGLQADGERVTPDDLKRFRDNWTKDGQKMDFTHMKATFRDFANLLASTGAKTYGNIDPTDGATLTQGIREVAMGASAEYDKRAANGEYLHVLTDPELRSHILDKNERPMMKGIFLHRGGSARSLSDGDAVEFHDRVDTNYKYEGVVTNPVPTPEPTQPVAATSTVPDIIPEDEQEFDFQNEQLMGWKGGELDGREFRGLSHVIGAYLTSSDQKVVEKNVDSNEMFDGDIAENSLALLQHMRSNGYDFDVLESNKRNQIDVRLKSSNNVTVRVLEDNKDKMFVGRVYDTYNTYHNAVNAAPDVQRNTKFDVEDTIAILDFVTGNKVGKVDKTASTNASQVRFEGNPHRKFVRVTPASNERYRSLIFTSPEEAEEHIREGIESASGNISQAFNAERLQAFIDNGLESEDVAVTSPEFQAELEALYSKDEIIRKSQEKAVEMMYHSDDGGLQHLEQFRDDIIGNYETGFNPAMTIDYMNQTGRGNERDAMMSALKIAEYDLSKVQGNDFAVNALKERLVAFDPDTAKSIDEIEHPMVKRALETVHDTLKTAGFKPVGEETGYDVKIDDNGVIKWEAQRSLNIRERVSEDKKKWQTISGEIGQIMVPNEHGIIETKFQGDNNYGFVPGHTGYFSFEGDYEDRMSRFRAKGYEQQLQEQLTASLSHQMVRPYINSIGNIPTTLDSSAVNGLYHGDVYGKRIEPDFMESSQLNKETKDAILQTLSNRVRFDNQFSDYATTSAETQSEREYQNQDNSSEFSYWQVAGGENMRVLHADIENYADTVMTGTGKTQGLIWYLTDGTKVNEDGSVTPSEGIMQEDGTFAPDKTAMRKLPYFKNEKFNAWDRNQMSANELMTAPRVDEKVNMALITFGGWTFDDSYAVSKEFADRNQVLGDRPNEDSMAVLHSMAVYNYATNVVGMDNMKERYTKEELDNFFKGEEYLEGTKEKGMVWSKDVLDKATEYVGVWLESDESKEWSDETLETLDEYEDFLKEHGRFRSLQRGDKITDFGGNKGTIGIIVDRDMPESEAKAQKIDKEVRFMKANPELDVIGAPYAMLSRHNAGVVKDLMETSQDLVDPDTGKTFEGAMGEIDIIVSDNTVDSMTHAYSREAVLDGKGRKASGQLSWALQSKGAEGILNEIYGRNDNAWETYREYLIATGLDMKADGTVVNGYQPHAGETRNDFEYSPEIDSAQFLNNIKDNGGFLNLPFDVDFKTGEPTSSIPVLSGSLRQNVELVDGTMRRSDFTNHYANIYEGIGEYEQASTDKERQDAQAKVQNQFNGIQDTIIDRQFEGGHNGKNSYIREHIMGKRMQKSATGVAIVDPRLEVGQAGMNQEMMDALDAKEGDTVMMFRDPVWRDGAIRAMTVVKDDSVHGVAFNPITDKSHDGDFDGDTMGLIKFDSAAANKDLQEKFSHWSNMIDLGDGKGDLYFQTGMDLATADFVAEEAGDNRPKELLERAQKQALSSDPRVLKQGERNISKYSHIQFREHGFGGDYINFTDDTTVHDSLKQMHDRRAKGGPQALNEYMNYHNGLKTDQDARDIQYATGVKSDDTGLAGAFSQKLVSTMRNHDIQAALEAMYPLSQGTLQIKHDPEHAKVVNKLLTDDFNQIFNSRDPESQGQQKRNSKMTPSTFQNRLTKTMTHEDYMDVDVDEKWLEAVADTLTHKGQVLPLKEAMEMKGAPMDRVAYGGGYEELKKLANNGESLLTGKQNKLFAPFSMRNATEETMIAKRDTQIAVEVNTSLNLEDSATSSYGDKGNSRELEESGMSL